MVPNNKENGLRTHLQVQGIQEQFCNLPHRGQLTVQLLVPFKVWKGSEYVVSHY